METTPRSEQRAFLETLTRVLAEHRIVGVSGYGIEEVMCACRHNGWTGAGEWRPASWHPKHVANKIASALAQQGSEANR